jgi:uncharacterized protein (DUF2236 family)
VPEPTTPDVVARFSREGSLLLGGGRAILLQVADPTVGAAVAQHSDFAHRPLDRLRNTLTFVYGTLLGSPAEAALVARMTTRTHSRIPTANDPARQLWVAATLYETAVRVYERVHAPISPADAELVLASYAALGTALEVPASLWPASVADFDAYWKDAVAALDVGDEARGVAHDLFHPVRAPLWVRAVLPLTELLTASLLEPSLRAAFGMPWSDARERRASTAWAVIRVVTGLSPRRLRYWPSRYYLRRLATITAGAPQ